MGWFLPALGAAAGWLGGQIGANRQASHNKSLARLQHKQNMELLQYQLDYNTPANQMARFGEAGLNPNLIYGQGSPGNMESAPRYPDIRPADQQSHWMDLGTKFQQMKLMEAQADLTKQKVEESGVKQDVMRAQENLIKANPLMREEYVNSLVSNLESTAKIKEQEADFMLSKTQDEATGVRWERGFLKMQRELDLLEQKFNLGAADQKIKAEVMQSKEFQNAILEIQKKWLQDGDITSQHIYQGIMMLLSKMM